MVKQASAYLKLVQHSPSKVLRLSRSLVGMKVDNSLKTLSFCNLKIAPILRSLIFSAVSNAEYNHDMDVDALLVSKINVTKAPVLKRFKTRARGRSSKILKRSSSIRVYLIEKQ
jgi:large subunit ribosomal protein L22